MSTLKLKNATLAVLLGAPLSSLAAGTISSQEQLFLKCYEGITGNTPMRSSQPYQRVLNGEGAIKVCSELLDDMGINGEGYFKSNNGGRTSDAVVLEMAKGLHRVHNKFIPTPIETTTESTWYLEGSLSWQTAADYQTFVVMKDMPYSSLITSKKAYFPLYEWRSDANDRNGRMYQPEDGKLYGLPRDRSDGDNPAKSNSGYWKTMGSEVACRDSSGIDGPKIGSYNDQAQPMETLQANGGRLRNHGVFKGIFEETYNKTYPNCFEGDQRALQNQFHAKPHQSFGAGLAGMSGYMQAYAGFRNGDRSADWADGGMRTHRRWSKNVLEHFFCRKGAVLRIGDTAPFMGIPSTVKGEKVPTFRLASTCMQCHATIDSMAFAIRANLAGYRQEQYGDNGRWMIPEEFSGDRLPSTFSGSSVEDFARALPASDLDFFRRPPQGALYFRNFRGNLVYIGPNQIDSLDALGNAIAEQEDFYACAASKYLEQFTSYRITLDDPGANAAELNKNEIYNWFANTLVPHFYQHRSAKKLMKEIMESKYFQER